MPSIRRITRPGQLATRGFDARSNLWLLRAVRDTKLGQWWYDRNRHDWDEIEPLFGIHRTYPRHEEIEPLTTAEFEKAEGPLVRRVRELRGSFDRNIGLLADALHLSRPESDVLRFALNLQTGGPLEQFFSAVAPLTHTQLVELVATMLKLTASDVRAALASDSSLVSSGLVICASGLDSCERPLQVATRLAEIVTGEYRDKGEILNAFFHAANAPTLGFDDFPHMTEEVDTLVRYLSSALSRRETGVNVLLWGVPGAGKTQLARAIGAHIANHVFEVTLRLEEWSDRESRIDSYLLCQRVLAGRGQTLVVFDEVEDVFGGDSLFDMFTRRPPVARAKDRMHRILEENPIPAIWICNRVGGIDPAVLRRFDILFEMKCPPVRVRERIIEDYTRDVPLPAGVVSRLARIPALSPADAQKLARVVSVAAPDAESARRRIEILTEQRLLARGVSLPSDARPRDVLRYDLGYLNTSTDIAAIATALVRAGRGTLCLYGPPGTGKTALASHLARVMGRELVAKRASDLLSKWLGDSEQNIAAMFREASTERALLLLDEADSLLRDRRLAQRSWEVTQVNEMLVQMENFEGVFVCSTNLVDDLDPASARRFDFKIRFDFPTDEQRLRMFTNTLAQEGANVRPVPRNIRERLARFTTIAPGDFATVVRRTRILGDTMTAELLIAGLEAEIAAKGDGGAKKIGFV